MSRFTIGVVVGIVLLAIVQYLFAPLPSAGNNGDVPVMERGPVPPVSDGKEQAGQPQPGTTNGAQRNSRGQPTGSERADGESSGQDGDDTSSGPLNPIKLPDTHAGFVTKSQRSLPEEHETLENEEVDPSWAEIAESHLLSFISSHPDGQSISIVSLVCRTSRCEIAGTAYGEQGGDAWQRVLNSMQEQPWFATHFADSMYGAGGSMPGEHRFVTIIARVGTEMNPPVRP